MALQINTNLTTADGGSVAAGSYVKMELYFPMTEDQYSVTMKIWRNQGAYISNLASFKPLQIPSLNFTKNLTPAEMSGLTPTQVNLEVQAYLEQYVGEGNVTILG